MWALLRTYHFDCEGISAVELVGIHKTKAHAIRAQHAEKEPENRADLTEYHILEPGERFDPFNSKTED